MQGIHRTTDQRGCNPNPTDGGPHRVFAQIELRVGHGSGCSKGEDPGRKVPHSPALAEGVHQDGAVRGARQDQVQLRTHRQARHLSNQYLVS